MGLGTVFFIVLAAIVLFQLRSVLGRRTGSERPPFDPYSRSSEKAEGAKPQGNVVTLPSRRGAETVVPEPVASDPYDAIDKLAPPAEPLNAELRRVKDADASFDPQQFLDGVKLAYEMIVTAFAEGDRKTLKGLLSAEAYGGFETAITERESRSEKMQSSFIGIDDAKIVSAAVRERDVLLTVRIVSQMISAVLSSSGAVVDGDLQTVVEVRDVWTFARDMRSRDPNWKLVETQAEAG